VSLVARYLERNGIPTVVMGAAKDIVELTGVPRFLFSDFPLGNSCGKPHEPDTQAFTLDLALKVLDRGWRLEERLQQPRAHGARGSRQAPRRVRQGEADRAGTAQEGGHRLTNEIERVT
jgi:D-proline reductase (dithiol) PrdB